MEQKHSPECAEIQFSGYSQITSALPTPHTTARTRGCRQRSLSTFSLFHTELLLPGIPRVPPLQPSTGRRQDASPSSGRQRLPAGRSLPVWRARWRRGCWGRCRTPPAPRLSPHRAPPGGQRGDRSERRTVPSAPRAGSAPGTAPPRLAPHLASGSRRCAGALRGSAGPEWSTVRCRRRKSLHGSAPRADAFMGCGPGPAVNQRRRGAPPARSSAAVTQTPAAPSPPRLPAGPSPGRPAPAGGAGAARGRAGRQRPPRGERSGAEGRAAQPSAAHGGLSSVRRGPSAAEPPGGGARPRGRTGAAVGSSPVQECVLGPSGRPGSPSDTGHLRARCSCRQRGTTGPSRGLCSFIFILFVFELCNSPKLRLDPSPGRLAKCSRDVRQQLLK